MTGAIIWLLIDHFARQEGISEQQLRDYNWEPDDNSAAGFISTNIVIQAVTRWKPNNLQQRPAVYVKRNQFTPRRLSIGDRQHGGSFNMPPSILANRFFSNVDTGDKHELLLLGSHTAFCVGATGAEAELLGTEVFYRLLEFSPLIRQDLGLHHFSVMDMGSVKKLEESEEHWVVPVVVAHAHSHAWRLNLEAPWLKTVSLNTLTSLGGSNG